ncbi:hypothetical protein ACL07V_34540 [Streptomyces sp. MB22_4]|uniref:hypothetical protein n=1 Tax=Streptomyces sp. MB22_4 TaxID=3383120 RepID=UPI00399EEDD1
MTSTQVHLLAAMTGTGRIIAQREVRSKANEIAVCKPMLAPLGLADTVVTFDALHSQTEHARFLVEENRAHYIAVIKGNHPTLQRELKRLPWRDVPLQDKTRGTAHGRDEIRRIKTCTVFAAALGVNPETLGNWIRDAGPGECGFPAHAARREPEADRVRLPAVWGGTDVARRL